MKNFMRRHLSKLMHLGAVLMIMGWLWPLLIVVKIFDNSYFANFMAYLLMVGGGACVIVGLIFDNIIDRNWG